MESLKISKDCFIPKDNVKMITTYVPNGVKVRVQALKKADKVYDITGGKKISGVVFLKTGEAVLTNYTAETLNQRFTEVS